MHIAFDAKRAFFNNTGLGNYSRFIIEGLAQLHENWQLDLYAPKLPKDYWRLLDCGDIQLPSNKWKFVPSSVWRSYRIAELVAKSNAQIYHGLSAELPYQITKYDFKKVVTIHDLIFLRHPEHYTNFDVKRQDRKAKYACYAADLIIAISEQTKEDIVHFYNIDPDKIVVHYQSCADYFWSTSGEPKQQRNLPKRYILNVGSLTDRKNQQLLIKTLPHLPKDLQLVLVARNNEKQVKLLSQLAAALNVTDRVHFLHDVQDDELPNLYQKATVFAYPSLFEGFGIPLIEAMTQHTPIVTTDTSCFKEVAGKAALYYDQHDVKSCVAAIQRIIEDDACRNELMKAAVQQKLKFEPNHSIQSLSDIYANLMSK